MLNQTKTDRINEWLNDHPVLGLVGIVLTFALLGAVAWTTQSYMEAKAFNRVTGSNVSTLDAMFIELRVQESSH
jgi:hypothetical protein